MSQEVTDWMSDYDNPMKDVVAAMREVILAADPRIEECIKWKAPTFTYKGNMASFFPRSKKAASLMFHKGALIPGAHSILEGDAEEARSVKIASLDELATKRSALEAVTRTWCDFQDAQS